MYVSAEQDARAPERRVTGFHRDAYDHWVAELECGHTQHVRHRPPWEERLWVTTAEGRHKRLGSSLRCYVCMPEEPNDS